MSFPTISSIKSANAQEHEQGSVQGALYGARALASGTGPLLFAALFSAFTRTDSPLPYFPGVLGECGRARWAPQHACPWRSVPRLARLPPGSVPRADAPNRLPTLPAGAPFVFGALVMLVAMGVAATIPSSAGGAHVPPGQPAHTHLAAHGGEGGSSSGERIGRKSVVEATWPAGEDSRHGPVAADVEGGSAVGEVPDSGGATERTRLLG